MLDDHQPQSTPPTEIHREETLSTYHGAYPDPRQLAEYEAAVTGSALHLLNLAAERQEKELAILAARQTTRNRNSTLGIICAFAIAGLTIFTGYNTLANGATIEGLTLSGTGLAGLVLAFIRSTDDPGDGMRE